jgi:hypothetical protein
MSATPRVTVVGELGGRIIGSIGRLAEITQPHPVLSGVETVRLTGVREMSSRAFIVAGVKWNIGGTGILSGHVMKPLTSGGLTSRWMAALTFDYSFGY